MLRTTTAVIVLAMAAMSVWAKPTGLSWEKDLDKAVAAGRVQNKPVLVYVEDSI